MLDGEVVARLGACAVALRRRAGLGRRVGLETNFFALPQVAQNALDGIAGELEGVADELDLVCGSAGGVGCGDRAWEGGAVGGGVKDLRGTPEVPDGHQRVEAALDLLARVLLESGGEIGEAIERRRGQLGLVRSFGPGGEERL